MARKHYRRKPKGLSKVAAKSVKAIVKKATRQEIETKMLDTIVNPDTISWNGTLYDLSNIPLGTDIFNRVGAIVHLSHLDLRFTYYEQNAAIAPINRCTVRFIVFRYLNNTAAAAPTASIVLDPTTRQAVPVAVLGTAAAPFAKYNPDWQHNVAIIWDSGATTTRNSTPVGSLSFNKQINLRNAKLEYIAGALTGTGKLYLLAVSDISSLVAGIPSFSFVSRLMYKDG